MLIEFNDLEVNTEYESVICVIGEQSWVKTKLPYAITLD